MEAAKQAIAEFTARRGHNTVVDEVVRPAVTLETIKPTRHEIITEAVDKEVHQHHYHTTIQPLSHKEVLPTKHTHNLIPVVHRDFEDRTRDANLRVKESHTKEIGLFANHSITHPVHHTKSALPTVVGEHVHHHIHEIVQPIIFKEKVVPEVVHITIPIHELHYHEAVHHKMSELALISMEDFLARHKIGKSTMHESYEGPPRSYNPKLTVDPKKYSHKPTPLNIAATRNSTTTPPLSPASASSGSMPSTPKSHAAAEPGFRNSEDSMHDFKLSQSPSTKTSPKMHRFQNNLMQTPQQTRV